MIATNHPPKFLFEPINKSHSIVEVVLFVHFLAAFPPNAIRKIASLKLDLEEELPSYNEIQKIEARLAAGPGGPSGQLIQDIGGLELKSIKRDGSIEWMLRVHENSISVHCLDYSKWDDIWQRSHDYFTKKRLIPLLPV